MEDQKRSSPSRPALNNTSSSGRLSSQFASVRADLVEAATAVAQALGVQIVDDSPGTSLLSSSINTVGELASDGGNLTLHGGLTTKKSAAEDVWKLTGGAFYKWNDWRLVRYKDSFFLWCDAVAIEFRFVLRSICRSFLYCDRRLIFLNAHRFPRFVLSVTDRMDGFASLWMGS